MALSAVQMAQMSALLDEALELDEAGRRQWLERLGPEHRDLEDALRQALLPQKGARGSADRLATLPKVEAAGGRLSTLKPGDRVGPYRLERPLGSGGMAEVWLAQRADGAFKREVALKVPKLSRTRRDLALRFAHERDILAGLEHVNIARFYDAGVSPDGLPYLTMEYVRGEPLTAWCDANQVRLRERIKLFLQVLDAAQYAHARQVIHRDLKPSNILVTQTGQVRLLDFGVAKLLAEPDEQTQLTQLYGRALTPDYASPELVRGEAVDAAADVYSLGVVLYELLSGSRPYHIKGGGSATQLEQAIATARIERPSTQLAPQAGPARGTTQQKLARRLRGDLDAIVLKALCWDPQQRYALASALAADLRRHLSGEPVGARADSLLYRLGRFMLPHRTDTATDSAAAVGLVLSRTPAQAPSDVGASTPTRADSSRELAFGRFTIRPAERQLLVDGQAAVLGARAFDLLLTLAEHRDRVVSKNELLELVWPGRVVEENNLQVQISTLRRLLGPQAIATVPGRGYKFTAVPDNGVFIASIQTPAATMGRSRGNLPEPTSTLYGRERDVADLLAVLATHRLVTLIGAGGIGKSTLALAAARTELGRWDDGVWLIELAPVADPALVPATVAQAVGIPLIGRKAPVDEVADGLRSRALLLVLDNCEHLLAAVTRLADTVLARSHTVKILATSQEPLHSVAEQQVRVPPLAIPAEARPASPLDYGALALFEARVKAVDSRFRLDENNLGAAIEICRRLDCLPLAIELAAARVPLLGVEGVRARLDDRFQILTAGLRTGLSRHQTLRAAIEWSHSLLTVEQRAVFRRLCAFCGSFGLDAAQRVASDTEIDQWSVLDHLGALVDKSLVAAQAGEVPRYRLLETTRAFAWEKIGEAGETDAIQRAHAHAVLAAFERSFQERWREPSQSLLSQNLPDLDNLRAAFEWASRSVRDSDLLISLAGASAWLWRFAGLQLEGLRRCTEAIGRITAPTPAAIEARLHFACATFMFATDSELRACERAIELYRQLGDQEQLFLALILKAQQCLFRGDFAGIEEPTREAEELMDPTWPFQLRFHMLRHRAFRMVLLHRWDEARALNEDMLRLARESGDSWLIISALVMSIDSELAGGDATRSVARGREMLELLRSEPLAFDLRIGEGLAMLAAALTRLDQLDEALQRAREAAPLIRRNGTLGAFLDDFALLAFKLGRRADAARTLGRAEAHFAEEPQRRQPNEQLARDQLLVHLRQTLPEEEFGRYMEEGAAMSDEEATRVALGM